MEQQRIVTADEWLTARKALLIKEKALTRQHDALSAERRQLPMVKVEKPYVFDTSDGQETLADLFGNRTQLIVYHFMMGPDWTEGCPSCSLLCDHIDGSLVHLAQRDVAFVAISRAPLANIASFKRRMGWRFKWVSSYGNDFNTDYRVSFSSEEMASGRMYYNFETSDFPADEAPGVSIFFKNAAGDVLHTYSTYGRGGDILIGAYNYLDLTPKGRDEGGLPFPMAWVRHHDRYAHDHGASSTPQPRPADSPACCEAHETA
jgi:predicted dithiol-disulfide oxidoreductase (DUF899 family)